MKAEEICELAIIDCTSEGASDVVVSVTETEETMIRFSNNQITVSNRLHESMADVFVKVRERKAETEIVDLSKRSLFSACRKLVGEAKRGPPGDLYVPLPQGPFNYSPSLLNQGEIDMDSDLLVNWVNQALEAGLEEGAERMAGSMIVRNSKLTLQTSGNVFGVTNKSTVELSVRAFGANLSSGHSVSVATRAKDFKPEDAGREAGMMARLSRNQTDGQPGDFDAVLGPMVFADLLQQTGRFASAFYVDAGLSFLKDRLGQQIASQNLTLLDDPTLEGSYGAFPFDSEGLPTKRKAIIDKGVLSTYLHNTATARKMNIDSTANAGLINPQPFNLIVEGGKGTVQDLIAQVEKGIYVTNDWYLRYQNWSTGDFSMIPRDAMFAIEDGELKSPIKELRISGNLLQMLSNISQVGGDRKWIKWWEVDIPTLSPSALISSTRFTKSTM
jgi:PmbA protein